MIAVHTTIRSILALSVLLAAGLSAGCETTTPDLEPDVVVVEGFLYAGEPVRDIRLTTTSPITSVEETGTPLTNAVVWLVKNDSTNVFRLMPQPGMAGAYYYPGDDLTVEPGDFFGLAVEFEGQFTTAVTYIPEAPEAIEFSDDHLVVLPATNPDLPVFTVTWENPEEQLHWVSIRNTATVSIPIRMDDVGTTAEPIQSELLTEDVYAVNAGAFTHYGTHEVEVFRISAQYFALSQYVQRPVQRIYEPATNVDNGVGIFAGFHRVRFTITVQPR